MAFAKKGIVDSAPVDEAAAPTADAEDAANPGAPTDAEDASEAPEVAGETPDAEDQSEGAEEKSPEDESVERQVLLTAHKLMYSKEGFPILLDKLGSGKADIGQAVGHTLAMLLLSIQNSARAKGHEIKPDIILEVGLQVLDDMMQIGVSSGMIKPEFADKAKARALFVAFKVYGDAEIKAGHITPDGMKSAQEELSSVGIDPAQAAAATGATPQAPPQAAPGIVNQAGV